MGWLGRLASYLGSYVDVLSSECGAETVVPLMPKQSKAPAKRPRAPFGFVVSGGGFRTMTAGIAYARALSMAFEAAGGAAGWDDITHLAGNSGGQWYTTQLAFSHHFFVQLTERDTDGNWRGLGHFFELWGMSYAKGMFTGGIPPFDLHNRCATSWLSSQVFAAILGAVAATLELVHFPAYNWRSYIDHMLHCSIPGYEELIPH